MTRILNGLRVLLVEDSWDIGQAMRDLLRSWGAEVAGPAATTADAERLISDRAPDLAVVDVNLRHGERAYGLIDRLHRLGVGIVVLTGYSEAPLAEGKAAAILTKPIDEAQLFATLRQLAAGKARP